MISINQASTIEELRKTYRNLAKSCHPDLGGNHQMMQQLNQAYQIRKRILENSHKDFFEITVGDTIYVNGTEALVILVTKTKFVAKAKKKSKQAWFDRKTGIGIDFPYYKASFNPGLNSSNSN
jgi:curved DNA-binding protein CbpA